MPVTAAADSTIAALNAGHTTRKKTSSEEQSDRFLTLLVAQMKNQDPLSPLDNAQVTSQMAQVTTVQGIERLNDTMSSMLSQIQGMQAAGLAGREVLTTGNKLNIGDGLPARGGYQLPNGADAVTIEIRNAMGLVVATMPQGAKEPGMQTFQWDGTVDGKQLPAGRYTFSVAGTAAGKQLDVETYSVDAVVAVLPGATGVRLSMASGVTLAMDSIKAIL